MRRIHTRIKFSQSLGIEISIRIPMQMPKIQNRKSGLPMATKESQWKVLSSHDILLNIYRSGVPTQITETLTESQDTPQGCGWYEGFLGISLRFNGFQDVQGKPTGISEVFSEGFKSVSKCLLKFQIGLMYFQRAPVSFQASLKQGFRGVSGRFRGSEYYKRLHGSSRAVSEDLRVDFRCV